MLAEILVDIPLPQEPRLQLGAVNAEALAESLEELELFSLRRRVNQFAEVFSAEATGAEQDSPKPDIHGYPDADTTATTTPPSSEAPQLEPQLIDSADSLAALTERLLACTTATAPVALDTETTSLNPSRPS